MGPRPRASRAPGGRRVGAERRKRAGAACGAESTWGPGFSWGGRGAEGPRGAGSRRVSGRRCRPRAEHQACRVAEGSARAAERRRLVGPEEGAARAARSVGLSGRGRCRPRAERRPVGPGGCSARAQGQAKVPGAARLGRSRELVDTVRKFSGLGNAISALETYAFSRQFCLLCAECESDGKQRDGKGSYSPGVYIVAGGGIPHAE